LVTVFAVEKEFFLEKKNSLSFLNRTTLFYSTVPNINQKKLRKNIMLAFYAANIGI